MGKIELNFIGKAGFGGTVPVYKDQKGVLWADINSADEQNPQYRLFELGMDDFDDWEFALSMSATPHDHYPNPEIMIVSDYERDAKLAFRYSLLDRYRTDALYFLGNADGHLRHLGGESVDTHIASMLDIYDSLPEEKKPDWINREDIIELKTKMKDHPRIASNKEKRLPTPNYRAIKPHAEDVVSQNITLANDGEIKVTSFRQKGASKERGYTAQPLGIGYGPDSGRNQTDLESPAAAKENAKRTAEAKNRQTITENPTRTQQR